MKDTRHGDTVAMTGYEEESQASEASGGRTLLKFLTTLRTNLETKLEKEEVKPSIGDYLKVLQLERNFEEQPEEIQVRWVEPEESAEET